jgi:hypothetical protein
VGPSGEEVALPGDRRRVEERDQRRVFLAGRPKASDEFLK